MLILNSSEYCMNPPVYPGPIGQAAIGDEFLINGVVESNAEPDFNGEWHVLHTKSRQEKALCDELDAMRINHFLPLIHQTRFHGNRKAKVIVDEPLFPGYVFLNGSLEVAYRADRTKRLNSIITVRQQERLRWELKNLYAALSSSLPLDPYPYLKKGIRVEIRSGPLRGIQGLVEDRPRPDRLILQVDMLARAVSLEIDAALLEPLG